MTVKGWGVTLRGWAIGGDGKGGWGWEVTVRGWAMGGDVKGVGCGR